MNVAVIITAFNRRQKTLDCLRQLFAIPSEGVKFTVYLTDDGSSDGTSEAVTREFPQVLISTGNGYLYWAGGMNLSWKRAVKDGNFDGYLWLNDDTILKTNLWNEILEADKFCRNKYHKGGIYIGPTQDNAGQKMTYGGSVTLRKWKSGYRMLEPNGEFQNCEIANGNVTFISDDVVSKLGCLYPGYIHGGDYDYTYWAFKEGFPLLLLRDFVGYCDYDHKTNREILIHKSLPERIKYLYAPTGMQLPAALLFQKRFYPWFYPITFLSYWSRALFPWFYKK